MILILFCLKYKTRVLYFFHFYVMHIDFIFQNRILFETISTTLSNGYLGSRNDEERSEMRYVMRIAEFSESSNL